MYRTQFTIFRSIDSIFPLFWVYLDIQRYARICVEGCVSSLVFVAVKKSTCFDLELHREIELKFKSQSLFRNSIVNPYFFAKVHAFKFCCVIDAYITLLNFF